MASWSRENRCFSCHNDGDAARAMFIARKSRFAPKLDEVAPTVDFLAHPERWHENGDENPFGDKAIGRTYFT